MFFKHLLRNGLRISFAAKYSPSELEAFLNRTSDSDTLSIVFDTDNGGQSLQAILPGDPLGAKVHHQDQQQAVNQQPQVGCLGVR